MNKRLIATVLFALSCAALPAAASEDPQHHNPGDAPKTGEATPRPPQPRPTPNRPVPRGGMVIVPGYPWWYPYPYRYPPFPGWAVYADWETANIRIDVEPDDAQVYVDRYYAGVVDDFDGIFQHLTLRAGPHLLEIRKTGFTTLVAELNLSPGQSITYRRVMQPVSAGETPEAALPLPPGFEEGAAPPPPAEAAMPPGDVQFDVKPKDAEIYVDGFYAGLVDDFNGSQRLELPAGPHHLSIRMAGYETIDLDLSITAERSITYRAEMKKVR